MKAIVARRWNSRIVVENGKRRKRLRNWYRIDIWGSEDNDGFTWGYMGTGPAFTAYSILREFYGREMAEMCHFRFMQKFVSMLDRERGFRISKEQIDEMMPVLVV